MDEIELRKALDELIGIKEFAAELGIAESSLRARLVTRKVNGKKVEPDPDILPIARFTGPVWTRAQVDAIKKRGPRAPGPKPHPEGKPKGTRKK